jgi:hypothetical protein
VSTWTSEELDKIAAGEELELASARRDGTLRKPVTIWVVRHDDDVYVRSVNGRTSSWFRGVQARHEDHIRAGGVDKDVFFAETDDVNDEVDAAYRAKYRRYPATYVDPMVTPGSAGRDAQARAALDKPLAPRSLGPSRGAST